MCEALHIPINHEYLDFKDFFSYFIASLSITYQKYMFYSIIFFQKHLDYIKKLSTFAPALRVTPEGV